MKTDHTEQYTQRKHKKRIIPMILMTIGALTVLYFFITEIVVRLLAYLTPR